MIQQLAQFPRDSIILCDTDTPSTILDIGCSFLLTSEEINCIVNYL